MKKLLYTMLIATLTACSSIQTVDEKKQIEQIHSLLFDKNKNLIYALGTTFDYQVRPCTAFWGQATIENFQVDQRCLATFHYSLEHKDLILDRDLDFSIHTGASTQVDGYYHTYLKIDRIVAEPYIQNKQLDLRTLNTQELEKLNQKLNTNYSKEQVFKTRTWFHGNTVQLNNKNELLALGHLKQPLQVPVKIQQRQKSYSLAPIAKGAAAIVVAPIGLVLMLPYAAVIAYCEPGSRC